MGAARGQGEIRHSPETWQRAWDNRGLVYSVAQRYFPECPDHDEFLIDGLKGLCLAIERFDPARGKLSTFAGPHIRSVMGRAIAEQRSIVHYPTNVRERSSEPARSTIREGDGFSWDLHAAPDRSEDQESAAEAKEIIDDALAALPPKLATVIRRRFGIGLPAQKLREVAHELKVSNTTIDKRQAAAMDMIREHIERKREGRATA